MAGVPYVCMLNTHTAFVHLSQKGARVGDAHVKFASRGPGWAIRVPRGAGNQCGRPAMARPHLSTCRTVVSGARIKRDAARLDLHRAGRHRLAQLFDDYALLARGQRPVSMGLERAHDQASHGTTKKNPVSLATHGVSFGTLAVTYSSVATGKTTIGAERFHFRVRNGIGWFPLAIAARETCYDHRCRVLSHPTSPAANPEVL